MTSVPDNGPHPAAHPEVEEISDLAEDLLTPERAAEVRSHLTDCPSCADVLAALAEISELLGEPPAPVAMPLDVAVRIDAALATEAEEAAETAAGGSSRADALTDDGTPVDVPRGTSEASDTSPSAARDVPRGTSSAPAGHAAAAAGPGRRRRRRRIAVLTASWVIGALALGGVIYAVASTGDGSADRDSSSVSAKRFDSTPVSGSVGEQVRRLLADPAAPLQPNGVLTQAPNADNSPMLNGTGTDTVRPQPREVTAVPSCVLKATHRTQQPLAAGREDFEGTPSYLVVLPHPADSGLVDAFVVNASCSAGAPGAVLFQGTYPRR
jgi:hypothetical protein